MEIPIQRKKRWKVQCVQERNECRIFHSLSSNLGTNGSEVDARFLHIGPL